MQIFDQVLFPAARAGVPHQCGSWSEERPRCWNTRICSFDGGGLRDLEIVSVLVSYLSVCFCSNMKASTTWLLTIQLRYLLVDHRLLKLSSLNATSLICYRSFFQVCVVSGFTWCSEAPATSVSFYNPNEESLQSCNGRDLFLLCLVDA